MPFTLKVLDFGIAKWVADAKTTMTAAIGTPLWMAPEQTEPGNRMGPATDVWALGLIAFWLLTGKHYWLSANQEESTAIALLREVTAGAIDKPSQRAARYGCGHLIPAGFDAWFAKCVAREYEARFPDGEAAGAGIPSLLGQTVPMQTPPPISAVPAPPMAVSATPPTSPSRPGPLRAVAVVAVLAAGLSVAAWLGLARRPGALRVEVREASSAEITRVDVFVDGRGSANPPHVPRPTSPQAPTKYGQWPPHTNRGRSNV